MVAKNKMATAKNQDDDGLNAELEASKQSINQWVMMGDDFLYTVYETDTNVSSWGHVVHKLNASESWEKRTTWVKVYVIVCHVVKLNVISLSNSRQFWFYFENIDSSCQVYFTWMLK